MSADMFVEDLTPGIVSITHKNKKPSPEELIADLDDLISFLDKTIETDDRRIFRSIRVKVRGIEKKARKVLKLNKSRRSNITKKLKIGRRLSRFLNYEGELSRSDVYNALCVYIHRKDNERRPNFLRWNYLNSDDNGAPVRNLQQSDRRRFMPDKKLSKLLGYKDYMRRVRRGEITTCRTVDGVKTEMLETMEDLTYQRLQGMITPLFEQK